MELEVFTTNVELQDIPSYSTNITVEGQLLKLSFLWNERIGKRVLSIKNTSDVVYLQNTILHPNEPLELNSNAVLDDLPYSVTLVKTGDVNKVGNIFNWSKDFILCFSRTVDLDVKKLNVVYGVTTPSTPILPPPTSVFGDWILNQGFTILGDDIRYTGYKTNDVDTYDSFALSNLQNALVKSFLDTDLQQYAAFTTAVEQLTGTVDWVLDLANNQIVYYLEPETTDPRNNEYYMWEFQTQSYSYSLSPQALCSAVTTYIDSLYPHGKYDKSEVTTQTPTYVNCYISSTQTPFSGTETVNRVANPAYDPNATDEDREKTLPLEVVAQKVISNAESSEDEVLKLLSEDFINLVANSVFDNNPSKQFVKLEDLIPQLETNKVIR